MADLLSFLSPLLLFMVYIGDCTCTLLSPEECRKHVAKKMVTMGLSCTRLLSWLCVDENWGGIHRSKLLSRVISPSSSLVCQ
ncbi:hypothetical protein ScPMuIL_010425 [Solemya velum]